MSLVGDYSNFLEKPTIVADFQDQRTDTFLYYMFLKVNC